jgi:hypothetical protein
MYMSLALGDCVGRVYPTNQNQIILNKHASIPVVSQNVAFEDEVSLLVAKDIIGPLQQPSLHLDPRGLGRAGLWGCLPQM